MSRQRPCPLWVTENPFIESLLNALLTKLEQGKRPLFSVRKNKLFKPLYEFSDQEAENLWKLVLILAHEYQLLSVEPAKKSPQPWEPLYQGSKIRLNPAGETLLRSWLNRPAFDPYRLTWQDALQQDAELLKQQLPLLYENPLRIKGRSAQEAATAIVLIARYVQQAPRSRLSIRELSAQSFWGNSKYIETHKEYFNQLFPELFSQLLTRPLLVELCLPADIEQIVFIENQDTFLKAVRGEFAVLEKSALVYCAGFRIGEQKGRGPGEAVFAYVEPSPSMARQAFENWWFDQSVQQPAFNPPVYFWGDLDYAGMAILASMRRQFNSMQAWPPGYLAMLNALRQGLGHTPEEADKTRQHDPGQTGCPLADKELLPTLREQQRFIDQEWCTDL